MAFGLQCFGHTGKRKIAYVTRKDAIEELKKTGPGSMTCYHCRDCHQWHLAQAPQVKRRMRRR